MVSTTRILRALLLLVVLCSAAPACASVLRPNAIDHRITMLSPAALLGRPAAALVDPERQIAAARYTRWRIPGFLAIVLFPMIALAYFWSSGAGARVRDALRARVRSEFAVRWCFGALLAVIANLALLVPSFYLYRIERVMGLLSERSYLWGIDWLLNLALWAIVVGFAAAIVLWLSDRTHQWYLYTIAGLVAIMAIVTFINPILLMPHAHREEQLSPTRAPALYAIERSAGIGVVPILIQNRSVRSQTGKASIAGLWTTRRIVLSDTLVAGGTPGETRFYVAREAASIAHGDPLRSAAFAAIVVIVGIALAVFAADRARFRRDDDSLSRLALVGAFLGCAYFVVVPVYNAGLRAMEGRADGYAVALTGDRTSAVRAAVRAADQDMLAVCPGPFAELYFSVSPAAARLVSGYNGSVPACK